LIDDAIADRGGNFSYFTHPLLEAAADEGARAKIGLAPSLLRHIGEMYRGSDPVGQYRGDTL
jgi:hypothetical protein